MLSTCNLFPIITAIVLSMILTLNNIYYNFYLFSFFSLITNTLFVGMWKVYFK